MYKIKFQNSETLYNLKWEQISMEVVRLSGINVPFNMSGFSVVNENKAEMYVFKDFTIIYDSGEGFVEFTNDKKIYGVFGIYNSDNYIVSQIVSPLDEIANAVRIKGGMGKQYKEATPLVIFDENGLYKYKVENGEMVEIPDSEKVEELAKREKEKLNSALNIKINELSKIAEEKIVAGVTIGEKHYSFQLSDQNDIANAFQLAIATGLAVPYHADGESCTLYTPEEITTVYVAQEQNLTHYTTYYNQLKLYTKTLTTKEEVAAVTFGQELTGQYLDTYNMIMTQAGKIISAFLNK